MTAPDVSVVSVSWNTAACLPDALDALPAALREHAYEVIVVDNDSGDDSVAVLSSRPDVQLVRLDTNTGRAVSVRCALAARGDCAHDAREAGLARACARRTAVETQGLAS